jgi:transcriptional regulator with XRE-family HTH domain
VTDDRLSRDALAGHQRLHTALRQARDDAGLTVAQVARELEWSPSKVSRIEAGVYGISTTDLKALLRVYGITSPGAVEELAALARAARQAHVAPITAAIRTAARALAAEFITEAIQAGGVAAHGWTGSREETAALNQALDSIVAQLRKGN